MLRRLRLAASLVLLAAPVVVNAQPALSELLPETTVLALHVSPEGYDSSVIAGLFAELDTATAESVVERLGEALSDAADLGVSGMDDGAGLFDELIVECPELEPVLTELGDAFGPTAFGVSLSRFDPEPGLMLLTRPGSTGLSAALLDAAVACGAGTVLGEEAGVQIYLVGDGSDMPLVLADVEGTFAVASDPELLRGAIRRASGTGGRGLAGTRIGGLSEGMTSRGLGLTLNLAAAADGLELYGSLVAGDPAAGQLMDRVITTLRILNGYAWHATVDNAGVLVESVASYDARLAEEAGEEELLELLVCGTCELSEPTLLPRNAVSVSGGVFSADALLRWLDGWLDDVEETGIASDLDARGFLTETFGVDVDELLFGWIGESWHTATLDVLATDLRPWVQGLPTVMIMPVASEDAARNGVAQWPTAMAQVAELMESLSGDPDVAEAFRFEDAVSVREASYRGVDYYRYRAAPTVDVGIGVFGGHLVVTQPSAAIHEAIEAHLGQPGVPGTAWRVFEGLATDAPGIVGYDVTDTPAFLDGLAEISDLASVPVATALWFAVEGAALYDDTGTLRANDLPNFDELLTLADTVTEALRLLADRTGPAIGTTEIRDGVRWATWRLPLR